MIFINYQSIASSSFIELRREVVDNFRSNDDRSVNDVNLSIIKLSVFFSLIIVYIQQLRIGYLKPHYLNVII